MSPTTSITLGHISPAIADGCGVLSIPVTGATFKHPLRRIMVSLAISGDTWQKQRKFRKYLKEYYNISSDYGIHWATAKHNIEEKGNQGRLLQQCGGACDDAWVFQYQSSYVSPATLGIYYDNFKALLVATTGYQYPLPSVHGSSCARGR